jgi:hypothetical protein
MEYVNIVRLFLHRFSHCAYWRHHTKVYHHSTSNGAKEIVMAGNKQYDRGAAQSGLDHAGTRGPDSLSGRSDPADPDTGQRQQGEDGGSNAGHYTGSPGRTGDREGGIVSAPAESNVGPAGAPQSDRGSANASKQGAMTAAAAGGRPGTTAGGEGEGQGQSVDASVTGTSVGELARQTPDKPGGADSR